MQRIVEPLGASLHTWSAAAKVAPADVPTKIPSLCASSRLQRIAGELWDEIRTPSLYRMWLPRRMPRRRRAVRVPLLLRAAADHRCIGGLAEYDFSLGPFVLQHARHALERASGAEAGHPVIEPQPREVGDDLLRRCSGVHLGVGLVLELAREKPAMRLG